MIVDEKPSVDTRWCLEDDSTVILMGNEKSITLCPGDPKPPNGFVWTRVGLTTVDKIHGGYADGQLMAAPTNESDMAFAGALHIYGEFASTPSVAYYQVNAGHWSGNPSRSGIPPTSAPPISNDLYNMITIVHKDGTDESRTVKMGPFSSGGLTNLYATQEHRRFVTPSAEMPAIPGYDPVVDSLFWIYNGLKVSAYASNLIGTTVGAVDLTITAYDSSFSAYILTKQSG